MKMISIRRTVVFEVAGFLKSFILASILCFRAVQADDLLYGKQIGIKCLHHTIDGKTVRGFNGSADFPWESFVPCRQAGFLYCDLLYEAEKKYCKEICCQNPTPKPKKPSIKPRKTTRSGSTTKQRTNISMWLKNTTRPFKNQSKSFDESQSKPKKRKKEKMTTISQWLLGCLVVAVIVIGSCGYCRLRAAKQIEGLTEKLRQPIDHPTDSKGLQLTSV